MKETLGIGMAMGLIHPGKSVAAQESEKTKSDYPWQIGCFTRPWDQFDYLIALDAIAEAGFAYVGLMTCNAKNRLIISVETTPEEAGKVNEEVKKRGLQVPCVYGGDIPVQQSLQAGIDGLKKLIDHCVQVGSKSLMMGGVGSDDLFDVYYKAIAECCDYAQEKKLGIVIKPHGGSNSTGPQCRKIIEKVGHKNFTLWYDPGNIYYYSQGALDPVIDAPTVDGIVSGMCVKDFRPPQEVLLNPGTGQVKFAEVFAMLKKGGFTEGPLLIETLAPGELSQLLDEAKQAKKFVEQFVGESTR